MYIIHVFDAGCGHEYQNVGDIIIITGPSAPLSEIRVKHCMIILLVSSRVTVK